jgi:hypothetical protein
MQPPPASDLLLPEGTRLVHIGPPKTGTTSVQSAFDTGRARLKPQGVHYAGHGRQPGDAVLAVTNRPSGLGSEPPPITLWNNLLKDVRGASAPRVVISSEFFADAAPEAIRRVVDDLDPSRVHVVVTLRPLAKILASQWQQFVQSGTKMALGPWLETVFSEEPKRVSPVFWQRHRHDELIARWAEVVGPDRMTAIVLDEKDHGMVLRVFEQLLGLEADTLQAVEELSNRSMTMAEVEVVRAFNLAFKRAGLSKGLHTRIMRRGAARHIKMTRTPPPGEPKVEIPQWALDRAGEISAVMVPAIQASGVRLVGDVAKLREVPRSRLDGDEIPTVMTPPDIGGEVAMGILLASGLARKDLARKSSADKGLGRPPDAPLEPPEFDLVPTSRLAIVLARRLRHRTQVGIARQVRRLTGRGKRKKGKARSAG